MRETKNTADANYTPPCADCKYASLYVVNTTGQDVAEHICGHPEFGGDVIEDIDDDDTECKCWTIPTVEGRYTDDV